MPSLVFLEVAEVEAVAAEVGGRASEPLDRRREF